MRSELARLHERLGVTTIYVTHDQVEAMTLGQRVAVMRDGVIQQVDSPQALYARPDNLFVAAFIGSPAMNLVEATVADGRVAFAGIELPLDRRAGRRGRQGDPRHPPGGVRGRGARRSRRCPTVDVDVVVLEELGSDTHVIFPIDAPRVEAEELQRGRRRRGRGAARATTAPSGTRACPREDRGAGGRANPARGRHRRALLLRPGERARA